MYTPAAFREDDPAILHAIMREARLATLVTATAEGLIATPLPLTLAPDEGPHGMLYGHMARANPQWRRPPVGEAMVLFAGPHAYVSPSWYPSKKRDGKAVPTWNYVAVHAYGPVEFFEDEARLRAAVTELTDLYEAPREDRWRMSDAPEDYLRAMLRGIVGLRLPIARLEGKRKLSQNRDAADRAGVIAGLAVSPRPEERAIGAMIPEGEL